MLFDVTLDDQIEIPYDLVSRVERLNATSSLYSEVVQDQWVVTESLAAATSYNRIISDSATITDESVWDAGFALTILDTPITIADSASAGLVYAREAASDNLFINDDRTASTFYDRSGQDAVAVTDIAFTEIEVVVEDTLDLTDEVAASTSYSREGADTVDLTDDVLTDAVVSDVVAVTDALSLETDYNRIAEDAIDTIDVVSPDKVFEKSLSDSVSVADAVTAVIEVVYSVTLSDTLDLTDESAAEPILGILIDDGFELTDEIVSHAVYERSGTDNLVVTDQVTPSTVHHLSLSDTLSVSDSILSEIIKEKVLSENLVVSDEILRVISSNRTFSETIAITETVFALLLHDRSVTLADTIAVSDSCLAENINLDREIEDEVFLDPDQILRQVDFVRQGSDAISVSDAVEAKKGGEVDRSVADNLVITDSLTYFLSPGEISDLITIADAVSIEKLIAFPVTADSDGFGFTVTLPQEIRYDSLRPHHFLFTPLGAGTLFQTKDVEPVVTVRQTGSTGGVVYQGSQNFFSRVFRITGLDAAVGETTVSGNNVTAEESLSVYDSYEVSVLGSNPVSRTSGFAGDNLHDYIEVTNGGAPGIYRIINVLSSTAVMLDRPLPVVDSMNDALNWKLTSAIQKVHCRTSVKATNQENYRLQASALLSKTGTPLSYSVDFLSQGINGPKVLDVDVTEDGVVVVRYDQEMRADHELLSLAEYSVVGPTDVQILRSWAIERSSVALETLGLESGSYQLYVNHSGTPKDIAGNPVDPTFSQAVFSGSYPLRVRSIFTDKGPIAKPAQTLQSGAGVVFNSITEVTLPGGTFTSNHVGLYIRLGDMGVAATSTSSVVGTNATITDTVTIPDSLTVERIGATTTTYRPLSGTYRIDGVVSSTRVRLQASFSIPEPANGSLFWQLVDPRNGEIADDPSDVMVRVNGVSVTPDAVIGLLGQVVLPSEPGPDDDVKIDYSWCHNPTVEFRRLNSKEFRLNSWNRDNSPGTNATQHKYRYNNVLIRPDDYESDDMLSTLEQPTSRELHYRAYERAYTPVLNDPTLLLLNSPVHRIAYPSAERRIEEEFVIYEATALPENDVSPWVRHGAGAATVSAGVLTVTDNIAGIFPFGQPLFWTKALDLTFQHAFAMSWRFNINTVATYDGVFSGVAAGYTDESAAYVVGFLLVGGVRKIGFLKRGAADNPSLVTSWTGGLDSLGVPTGQPVNFDWSILHSYRIFRDTNGVVRLYVDGDVQETLQIIPSSAPFLEELASPFDEIQGAFFGSLSRPAENSSEWDFVRYLILPTSPLQTSPSNFVSYEGSVIPELSLKPWTPVGYHGTETILSNNLLLDSTSATDATTATEVGLMGGDFRGFVRLEPLLMAASQVVVDVGVQLRTYTHGVDPYGLIFAVDDGSRLMQVAFLAHESNPKLSYGGRSLPEDFSPYGWSVLGGATASMVGRVLRISDTSVSDGKVYFVEDLEPPASDDRVIAAATDYFLEFRTKVVSYTVDGAGFAGVFGQIFDSTRSVGLMFEELAGVKYVSFHADGTPLGSAYRFAFNWGDSSFHTYRFAKSTSGDLVTLFIDGVFVGSAAYSLFAASGGTAMVSFGSSTALSSGSLSVVDWAYCNAWRTRNDHKRYVGLWKGSDSDSLTGYHLPLKASGRGAQATGNALGDGNANFTGANVVVGDLLIVDEGPNKGVYEVAGVGSSTSLTIAGTWPVGPTLVNYRIAKETDWSTLHKYRLTRDTTGDVSLFFENETTPLILVGYNSIDLPASGVGIVTTLSSGLAAIAFGSFSSENLEQSYWDFIRYGISRSSTELEIAPHHQVLNQWNVMQSPERLFTSLAHELTSYKSSSTGVIPKKSPDFLADPALVAHTILNDSTPLVPKTQTFQVRGPYPVQDFVAVLNGPENVLNNPGDFVLNDASVQYRLVVPDDILYSSLDVIEQATGKDNLLAPADDLWGPTYSGFNYTKEVCLTYNAESNVLPENDTAAPTSWVRESDVPSEVLANVFDGVLTYRTLGSKTLYKNNTTLLDAPSLQTRARFRLRIVDDASLGTGDTKIRFGLSAPGLTVALAFVTTPLAERYILAVDLKNGKFLGSISFNFLDGNFHTYEIIRDPGAGVVLIFADQVPPPDIHLFNAFGSDALQIVDEVLAETHVVDLLASDAIEITDQRVIEVDDGGDGIFDHTFDSSFE